MSQRAYTVTTPPTRGADVAAWQKLLIDRFEKWDIDYPLVATGVYDVATRAATASFMRAWGVQDTGTAMQKGLTGWWRTKLRDDRRSPREEAAFRGATRKKYRADLRDRYKRTNVASPIAVVLQDSWGYHPPVHDGLDLL